MSDGGAGVVSVDDDSFEPLSREQNPRALLQALTVALQRLESDDVRGALEESFQNALVGLGAAKGVLLYVRDDDPLEILLKEGLTEEQAKACSERKSADGVSPSVIQQAIDTRQPRFIVNSEGDRLAAATTSLSSGAHSVLCAPILDHTGAALAVCYYQTKGVLKTFDESDFAWLTAYAKALGETFRTHFARQEQLVRLKRDGEPAPEIIGDSKATKDLLRSLHDVYLPNTASEWPSPILILGDSGTGKDLVARYIRYYSPSRTRSERPLTSFNCAGLKGDMAESRLFGHVKGAFTGALSEATGAFRDADKGVLFLDEIGELPLETQALFLRVLETREVQPVGTTRTYPVDVQLILATNRDLEEEVRAGRFRNDLFSRISGYTLRLTPLSARSADIRPLLSHYVDVHQRRKRKLTGGFTPEAFDAMRRYSWPNNVRELDHATSLLIGFARHGEPITLSDIRQHCPSVLKGRQVKGLDSSNKESTFDDAYIEWLEDFLARRTARHSGHIGAVAESLGINRERLRRLRGKVAEAKGQGSTPDGDD